MTVHPLQQQEAEQPKKYDALLIESIRDGGFVVREFNSQPGFTNQKIFATTTIDDALAYIKQRMQ